MLLRELHAQQGSALAGDGIPLHYSDLSAEYHAAVEHAVLMDRSHEARLSATGRDRLALLHRISTNDLLNLKSGEGRPTLFTNANARILDRAVVYHRGDDALLLGEPGRGAPLLNYLQRQIFFNDQLRLSDPSTTTHHFALHGARADAVAEALVPGSLTLPLFHSITTSIAGASAFLARNQPLSGGCWSVVVDAEHAVQVWQAIIETGKPSELIPAGSLTYNVLRIRAGRPGIGRELSQDYIPLEIGLWDEVSFTKGCYTGQEILARMESRQRLAKTLVHLELEQFVEAPAELFHKGRRAGMLTSSVAAPDGTLFALGVVKMEVAQIGQHLIVGTGAAAQVSALAGTLPAYITPEELSES